MESKKSFTLIELLVVISIIGLLSSIVLVNIKGTREKARIAKAMEFSSQIYHALGSEAVEIWRFEENPAIHNTTIIDYSGNGNSGTLITNDGSTNKSVPGIIGQALSFDGVDDYVNMGQPASLNLGTGDFTLETWIKNSQSLALTSDHYAIMGEGGTGDFWQFALRGGGINGYRGVWFRVDNGATPQSGYPATDYGSLLSNGNWHHVVLVRLNTVPRFYIDGADANYYGTPAVTNSFTTSNNLTVGKAQYGNIFKGLIDEVRIYKQALTLGQIQKHYAEGLETHKDLAIK